MLLQCGRHREKASAIATLSISPARGRVGLYFSLASDLHVDGPWMFDFLQDFLRHLRGPVLVVWDRLNVHKSAAIARFRHHCRLFASEWFPPYAPELNPVEMVWSHLKRRPLADFVPANANDLATITCRHARRLQRLQDLLRSFTRYGRVSLRL